MMPGVNGFEVLSQISEDGSFADMRIVMASAKAYEADRNKARKLGADGYIVKLLTLAGSSLLLAACGILLSASAPYVGYRCPLR